MQNNKNIQLWRKAKFLDRGYKEAVEIEPTLGDILAGALKSGDSTWSHYSTNIAADIASGKIKEYVPWES